MCYEEGETWENCIFKKKLDNIDREEVPKLIETLIAKKYKVYEIKMLQLSLEDAFLEKTGGNVIV